MRSPRPSRLALAAALAGLLGCSSSQRPGPAPSADAAEGGGADAAGGGGSSGSGGGRGSTSGGPAGGGADSGSDGHAAGSADAAAAGEAGDDGSSDDAAGDDAGSDGDGPGPSGPCGAANGATGPIVDVYGVATLPQPAGGAIQTGTYVLMNIETATSDPGQPTGAVEQKTLVLAATAYSFDEAEGTMRAGPGPLTQTGGTYGTSGMNLVLSPACPSPAATASYPFSSAGGELSLFRGTKLETYQLLP